jgi:hypothetical protein
MTTQALISGEPSAACATFAPERQIEADGQAAARGNGG